MRERSGRQASLHWKRWLLGLFLLPSLTSCSANPATGKQQLNFYSEAQEIAMGREADAQVTAELGLVGDPELQAWVAGIGKRLAAQSERPNLPWSFKVVDDPVVNAFALPGGFIYVTRGILAHLRTEAELAAVLGHEIGHVTAQHGVNQMSKAQLATGGLIVGMVLAPDGAAQSIGQLAQTGLGLLFLKYSRNDEQQADDLGLRYAVRTGFEPRQMPLVFDVLRRVSELEGGGRIPSWLASHPDPEARRERSERMIAERSYPRGAVGEREYLRAIDGIIFGNDPREGYFEGSTFFHPQLGFRLDFPHGWTGANEKSRVVALHPDKIAQVELTLAVEKSASEAARAFLAQEGIEAGTPRRAGMNGLQAVQADFSVPRENASKLVGGAAFVELGGRVFRLLAVAIDEKAAAARPATSGFLRGFSRLTERRRLEVAPQRVRLVEITRDTTLAEFERRYPSDARPEIVALINGVDGPESVLAAGTLAKRIEGEEIGSQRFGPEAR